VSLFFALTKKRQPEPTNLLPGLGKPEPEAKDETNLQTVARRLVDDMMQRGPIDEGRRSRLATGIHFLFGALWGGLYGLARESFRIPPQVFGTLVWMASDNLLLPAFRLAGWPQHYKPSEHRYAMQAHLAYGVATAGAYAVLRDLGPVPLRCVPALVALQAWAFVLRSPPARLLQRSQPWPRRFLHGTLVQKAALA